MGRAKVSLRLRPVSTVRVLFQNGSTWTATGKLLGVVGDCCTVSVQNDHQAVRFFSNVRRVWQGRV